MGNRRTSKQARAVPEVAPPPFPATEWGDEEEFKRFWGKSIDEIVDECEREPSTEQSEVFLSDQEFLDALRREMKPGSKS